MEDQVTDYLSKLGICRLMESDQIHTRLLREPADVIARTLSIIFRSSWLSGNVPDVWETSYLFSERMRRRVQRITGITG